ncbi:GNAT family N-acetyltransferase [Bacillus sp. AFS041924]|uniref:GNAT family N-acetyltransferase n=1 Tax=Bacillus sp. AFS041924 TaxID=2033503 RepID=UPI000BFD4AE6|nr:GNAT family N-acetyltransferase [Bacillus sp. AFS041924]PGS47307.1 GNAT family N-acetyltransferase [Bacillus sp. AFS041924]
MINIVKVKKEEESILHNLMQFYIYEFTKYLPNLKLGQNGSYHKFNLENYWANLNHHAFFVKHNDELIGFALIEASSENCIEEFFIIEKYKGKGFGKKAAIELFDLFPGKWYISQIETNEPAKAFWRNVIHYYTKGNFTEKIDVNKKTIQEFNTFEIIEKN